MWPSSSNGSRGRSLPATGADVTSATHPLSLSWVYESTVTGGGKMGLCYCPGKHVGSTLSGATNRKKVWARDLKADLTRLRDHFGVTTVVCLLSDAELRCLKVRDYAAAVRAHNLRYVNLPMIEMAAPDDFDEACALISDLRRRIESEGEVLAVHCKGGIGRAGLVASCVLLALGRQSRARDAIGEVRRRRCKTAVETSRQEDWVARYEAWLRGGGGEGGGSCEGGAG